MHEDITQMFDLRGKTALVTGGARHLGFDAASVLAAAGCRLAITSRDVESAQNSARKLTENYGIETLPLALDQRNAAAVAETVSQVKERFGGIDILVNNAGGTPKSSAAELTKRDPADVAALIELNLTAVLYVCREAGKAMIEQKSGKIINIASIAGIVGRDRRIYERSGLLGQPVDYAAAKAGIIGATRDLAAFFAPFGVNVNAISPGGFERADMPPAFVEDYSNLTPLGRMGRDGVDLKGAVLFFASPASDYVTGQNLAVDGGFTVWR
ncbi:MAG TPA: SDR family oxidoreductase [Pyrinomonadaceae bacterium]|jgi:NAD(P)-dependent dehydrogenase (short-subunit alcohol dehydrogenase family)